MASFLAEFFLAKSRHNEFKEAVDTFKRVKDDKIAILMESISAVYNRIYTGSELSWPSGVRLTWKYCIRSEWMCRKWQKCKAGTLPLSYNPCLSMELGGIEPPASSKFVAETS